MKKILRQPTLFLLLATSMTLSACGSGNSSASSAPNTGNIPNLAARPSAQSAQVKKLSLAGDIFDSLNQHPIEKAEILLQVVSVNASSEKKTESPSDNNHKENNNSSKPNGNKPSPSDTPFPGASSSPTAPNASSEPNENSSSNPNPDGSLSNGANPSVAPLPGGLSAPGVPGGPDNAPPPPDASLPTAPQNAQTAQRHNPRYILAQGSAQGATMQLAQNSRSAQTTTGPNQDDDVPNVFKTTTNNRGKFFINDVPEGTYMLTIIAPGYRSLTLTDINPNNLSIPLTALAPTGGLDVVGSVLSPSEKPVADAFVSPSFPLGEAVGIPANTNDLGEFLLPAVTPGKHSILAFVLDDQQQIQQMGMVRDLPLTTKTLKVKTTALDPKVQTTPVPDKSATDANTRKSLEDSVQNMLKEESPAPGEASPSTAASTEPTATEASPILEPAASPEATPESSTEPSSPQPDASGNHLKELSENEEEAQGKDKKGFNLLNAVKELVTGQKDEEESSNEKIYPVIPLRSVLNTVKLGGTVTVPEDYQLKQVEVYLTLPAADGEQPQEIYLFARNFVAPVSAKATNSDSEDASDKSASAKASSKNSSQDKKASKSKENTQRFQLKLPELDKGQSYHLQFTASHEGGQLSYHHIYNLNKSDEELAADFVPASGQIEMEGEDVNAIPTVPGIGWEAVSGAEIYHVTLEAGTGANRNVIWEAWTKETQLRYPLTDKEQRLKEDQTYTVSVAAVKGLHPAVSSSKTKYAHPAYQAIWTDLSRVTHRPFEVVE